MSWLKVDPLRSHVNQPFRAGKRLYELDLYLLSCKNASVLNVLDPRFIKFHGGYVLTKFVFLEYKTINVAFHLECIHCLHEAQALEKFLNIMKFNIER